MKLDEILFLLYDIMFFIGDFYVLVLVFKYVLFDCNFFILVVFYIYDRKLEEIYLDFWRKIVILVLNINRVLIVLVIDREKVVVNVIKKVILNVVLVYCWNYIYSDVKYWIK